MKIACLITLHLVTCLAGGAAGPLIPDLKAWHVDEGKESHRFYIEAPGEFRLGFVRAMNYGLSEWYDLHHDPKFKSNLTRRELGKNPNGFQGALYNQVINPHDVIAHIGLAGTRFKDIPKTLTVVESTPRRVIVETSYRTMLSAVVSKEFKLTTRYAIYPTGRIYIRNTLTFEQDYTLTLWRHATVGLGDPQHYAYGCMEKGTVEVVSTNTLRNPKAKWKPGALKNKLLQQPKWNSWLITDNSETELTIGEQISGRDRIKAGAYEIGSSETIHGWLRGNDQTNPHGWHRKPATFNFTYWDKTTPPPYSDYARASVLLAPSPRNTIKGSSAIHSWKGFKRHYFGVNEKISRKKGDSITQHYFIQLGAENSALLPNIRSRQAGAVYAESYLSPIAGVSFDRQNGCYRMDLTKPIRIVIQGTHPYPAVECLRSNVPSITRNGNPLTVGKDYHILKLEKGHLVQFTAFWKANDVIELR